MDGHLLLVTISLNNARDLVVFITTGPVIVVMGTHKKSRSNGATTFLFN